MRFVALTLLGIVSLPALAAPAPAEPCSPTRLESCLGLEAGPLLLGLADLGQPERKVAKDGREFLTWGNETWSATLSERDGARVCVFLRVEAKAYKGAWPRGLDPRKSSKKLLQLPGTKEVWEGRIEIVEEQVVVRATRSGQLPPAMELELRAPPPPPPEVLSELPPTWQAAMGRSASSPQVRELLRELGAPDQEDPGQQIWLDRGLTLRWKPVREEGWPDDRSLQRIELEGYTWAGPKEIPDEAPTHGAVVVGDSDGTVYVNYDGPMPRSFDVSILGQDGQCQKGTCSEDGPFEATFGAGVETLRVKGMLAAGTWVGDAELAWVDGRTWSGAIDAALRPDGEGTWTTTDVTLTGPFIGGLPQPDGTFVVARRKVALHTKAPIDARHRPHGEGISWLPHFGEEGPNVRGRFEHGEPVGHHTLRPCADCAVVREADYDLEGNPLTDGPSLYAETTLQYAHRDRQAQKAADAAADRARAAKESAAREQLVRAAQMAALDANVAAFERHAAAEGTALLVRKRFVPEPSSRGFSVKLNNESSYVMVIVGPTGTMPNLEVQGQMSSAISTGVLGHDRFTITCTRPPARDVCVGRIGTANFTPAGETTGFDFELFAESPASALQMQPLNRRAPPLYVALFEDPP